MYSGMSSGMTIAMYIRSNYAHVAQQYFLFRFTKYTPTWLNRINSLD